MARVIETNMIEAYRELHRFLGACNDGRARQTMNYTYLVYDKDEVLIGIGLDCGGSGVEFTRPSYSQVFTAVYWSVRHSNARAEMWLTPRERDLAAAALGIVLPNLDPAE